MSKKFQCANCKIVFEASGTRKEYNSPLYGTCVSFIAYCPECKEEAKEYITPKRSKSAADVTAAPCGGSTCACPYH